MHPTRLYIKRHRLTGKMYFGKTQKTDIQSYTGSGILWKRHLKKHGKDIETLWVSEPFSDKTELQDFALAFSELFDIVKSHQWANLQEENGLDGAPIGVKNSGPVGPKNGMYGRVGELNPFFGKSHSDGQKIKWSEMRLGVLNPNYGAKAFTEETYKLLRRPKSNKENYKGSPGKINCINKNGKAVQITTAEYHKQKLVSNNPADWEYVATRSKEAILRKKSNEMCSSL